ncbi:DUF6011 domain-containing protein [Streptomyces scopuliridis]|uniref:DUF6011 domain-containing protein n=1 Tax=Streptomyces scopuliridis TaxID=452529 RepID=UPI00343B8A53
MARRRTSQDTIPGTPASRTRRHCRKCGRPLTHPDSRLAGYGPDCDPARRPGEAREHHVEQDTIPGT